MFARRKVCGSDINFLVYIPGGINLVECNGIEKHFAIDKQLDFRSLGSGRHIRANAVLAIGSDFHAVFKPLARLGVTDCIALASITIASRTFQGNDIHGIFAVDFALVRSIFVIETESVATLVVVFGLDFARNRHRFAAIRFA